jgi:thiosulfate dehydrogenase [quinone] large subunit
VSPLGDLIRAFLPLASPIGLAIAIAEIGIGIGALSGLAFRIAAIGGAGLSVLFFLTASWATHPFYVGADLPYTIGWISLAIAGHGDLLVPAAVRMAFARGAAPAPRPTGGSRRPVRVGYGPRRRPGGAPMVRTPTPDVAASPERRQLLQAGALAGLAAILASLAWPLRALGVFTEPAAPSPGPTTAPAATATPAAAGTPPPAAGRVVARVADIQAGGGAATFTVPVDAPAPLPGGDPGVIVQLADGTFVAFDAVCTHAGCTVGWDARDGVLLCPCHEAAFDPANGAAVLQGPARRPLAGIPIVVDQAAGTITLGG